jgi:hypothetical protein
MTGLEPAGFPVLSRMRLPIAPHEQPVVSPLVLPALALCERIHGFPTTLEPSERLELSSPHYECGILANWTKTAHEMVTTLVGFEPTSSTIVDALPTEL